MAGVSVEAPRSTKGRGRVVLGANAATVLVVLILVAAVALVVKPPSPPGLAEFAPQATHTISKAPPSQAAKFGGLGGQCAGAAACGSGGTPAAITPTTTIAAAAPLGVPSALQCFTWPNGAVTQTSDPQSPPCVATWPAAAKGNGGATSAGITATTIRVAYPQDTASGASSYTAVEPIVSFLNSHFELYGRQIQLVPYPSKQDAGTVTASPTQQQSDAAEAASRSVFAALDFVDYDPFAPALPSYLDTLAGKGIVTLSGGWPPPSTSESDMAAHSPYEWSYYPPISEVMTNFGTWVCRQLVGHDAVHATSYAHDRRKFALVMPTADAMGPPPPGLDQMKSELAACGLSNLPIVYYDPTKTTSSESESFVELKAENVTTILFYPFFDAGNTGSAQNVAQSINYQPEWATAGWDDLVIWNYREIGSPEADTTFGIGAWNKDLALASQPWYQAYLAGGGSPTGGAQLYTGIALYRELLILASGAQMAGPRLTPQSLARALQSTSFPNPGAGAEPYYQAAASFSQGHSLVSDMVEWWDNPSFSPAQAVAAVEADAGTPYEAFCYVDHGARFANDGWPSNDSLYSGSCR